MTNNISITATGQLTEKIDLVMCLSDEEKEIVEDAVNFALWRILESEKILDAEVIG